MKTPYKYIIEFQKETENFDYTDEVNNIIFYRENLIEKLEKNKLKKADRENLILLLELLT